MERLAFHGDLPFILAELDSAARVAVDTEFHAERRYEPHLYLVQLHPEGGRTWLIDALDRELLAGVAASLRRVTWVVHGGAQDLRLLERAIGGVPERVLDTQIAAALTDLTWPVGYGPLVERRLGRVLTKAATLSDWSRRPLTEQQLAYAAADVSLLLPLWDSLAADLAALGREAIAEAACAEARQSALSPGEPPWREILGSATLTPQQASVLQELAIWREEVAQAEDQPPRVILGDGLLLDLARRQPADAMALGTDRRLSKPLLKKHGQAVIERIARSAARPEWAWPKVARRDTPAARSVAFLEVLAEAVGREGRFAGRFVLPRQRLEALACDPPLDRGAVGASLGPWRDALAGDAVWAAFQGEASLSLRGGDVFASGSWYPPR
jgi:ribonuclease D